MKASQMPVRKPFLVVTLEPKEFADTWTGRPKSGVAFGIRLLSDSEEGVARMLAAKSAAERYDMIADDEAFVSEYNDALMANALGAAICDPNDIGNWPDSLPVPQESIRDALNSHTIRRLFEEYVAAQAQLCPGLPEATNDEIDELLELLADLDELDPASAARIRRLLKRAHEIATER